MEYNKKYRPIIFFLTINSTLSCRKGVIIIQYEIIKNAAQKYPSLVWKPFDALMEEIGFEPLFALTEEFGGSMVYIPTKKTMFKYCLAKEIINEFDGGNHKYLAGKYDFSVKGIRDILMGKYYKV